MHEHQIEASIMKDGRCIGRLFATAERLAKLCGMGVCPAENGDCPFGRSRAGCAQTTAQDWISACSGEDSRG